MNSKKGLSIEIKEKRQEIKKEWHKKIGSTIGWSAVLLVIGVSLYFFFPETANEANGSINTLALVFTTFGSGLIALCIYRWHEITLVQLVDEDLKKREKQFLFGAAVFVVLLAIVPCINSMLLGKVIKLVSVSGLGVFLNLLICTFDSRMTIEEKRLVKKLKKLK